MGGCAGRLNASAASPALVYGKADPGRDAELRFVALGPQSLVAPDPGFAAGQGEARLLGSAPTIWSSGPSPSRGDSYLPDPAKIAQLGIGLDGTTYGGTGKAPVPKIQRWTAKDEQGRPVTVMKLDWSEEFALASGVIIAYSQGEGGRQARLWATGPIRKNQPGDPPALFALPVACGAVDGQRGG